MASIDDIVSMVRLELGDQRRPFRQTYRGTGFQNQFDLPAVRIDSVGLTAWETDPESLDDVSLTLGTDFTLDAQNGIVQTTEFVEKDFMLTVQGYSYSLFSDAEIQQFVMQAVLQHIGNTPDQVVRFRDSRGFIRYEYTATTIETLPSVEILPVAVLASIQGLWMLVTDAATDVDVITAEGTHIPNGQRFNQLQALIAQMQARYEDLCTTLGVGMYRPQGGHNRRISRQTGRLVPIYKDREYDDNSLPVRIVLPIDAQGEDPDGPLSPAGNFYW